MPHPAHSPDPADEPSNESARSDATAASHESNGDDSATQFEMLAEVLAGPDGDLEQGRNAARQVLSLDENPDPADAPLPTRPSLVARSVTEWLHHALNGAEQRAEEAAGDFETYHWLGDTLGWVPESRNTKARVAAERALLELHQQPHPCPGTTATNHDPACPVVLHLAHAHRFDTEGWQSDWSPPATR